MPQSDLDSPLSSIRKREQELAGQILMARREAEAILAKAKERARTIKEKAEHDGAEEAEAYHQEEVKKIEQEVEAIKAEGQQRAQKLSEAGHERIVQAARAVIDFVLPDRGDASCLP